MTDPQPAQLLAKADVTLPVLAKTITREELERKLGVAYDNAVTAVERRLNGETIAWKKKLDGAKNDFRRLAQLMEQMPAYLIAGMGDGNFSISKNVEHYAKQLQAAATETDLVNRVKKFAEVIGKARIEGITIAYAGLITAKINEQYLTDVKGKKQEFVEECSGIVFSGIGGVVTEKPYNLNVRYASVAVVLGAALQDQIGIQKPEKQTGMLAFDDALIPQGHYPLYISTADSTVSITWPEWIGVGKAVMDWTQLKIGRKNR